MKRALEEQDTNAAGPIRIPRSNLVWNWFLGYLASEGVAMGEGDSMVIVYAF